MTLIVDAHEDIAWNALCYGRDYTQPARATREREDPEKTAEAGLAMLGLPEWLAGNVAVIVATVFVEPARSPFAGKFSRSYRTADEAFAVAMRQIDIYRRLVDQHAQFRLVFTRGDLEGVLATWSQSSETAGRQIGLALSIENGDSIRRPDEVERWHAEGVRLIGPAWLASRYCGGTGEPGPLTDDGVRLLRRMADLNLALDTSHMAEQAFFQAIDRYPGSVIASHSNPRRHVDTDRHLSDDMIRALIERDGVIGCVPFNAFLTPGWVKGGRKDAANLSSVIRAIDYVCQRAGDALHAGIGSDFDGGFGAASAPEGFDTVADLQKIGDGLRQAGYTPADVETVMGGNWLRILRQCLPD